MSIRTDEAFASLVATADDLHGLNSADALARAEHALAVIAAAETALELAREARRASMVELVDSGLTTRATAALLGVSHQLVSQACKAAKGEWGPVPRYTAAEQLSHARDAYVAARHAQDLRCEEYAMGYGEEKRMFYGDSRVAQYEGAEDKIRFGGFHEGLKRQKDALS